MTRSRSFSCCSRAAVTASAAACAELRASKSQSSRAHVDVRVRAHGWGCTRLRKLLLMKPHSTSAEDARRYRAARARAELARTFAHDGIKPGGARTRLPR